ncbi:MAG: hypothetical protein JO281_12860 [Pseudonocardiales bacterium]|nr:hypothetical protein [Pseudonocardiales bacterium]
MTPVTRRSFLRSAAVLGITVPNLRALTALASTPERSVPPSPPPGWSLPDIQFAINNDIPPARTLQGVSVRFPPVYTSFTTLTLTRTPTRADQDALGRALATIEQVYPFRPDGVFTTLGYGLPYFARLPGGLTGPLLSRSVPRLASDPTRFALEEAVPGPTDVGGNPGATKQTFNIPVRIEANDLVIMLRSDSAWILTDVIDYLTGTSTHLAGREVGNSGLHALLTTTSSRLMFVQQGLPRRLADAHQLPFAARVNPQSPMWMGFADQQTSGSGPPEITTFQGNPSARLTTAQAGDYFDNAAIMHLSHVIEDLAQFYAQPDEPFTERVQYMFRSDPIPSTGNHDQFTNGGGPAILNNTFQDPQDAAANAAGINTYQGEHRLGHLSALQRSSRAADGTPIHIRADGPGFDNLDVPDGSSQPKLHFCIFVPTADFFATLRRNQASLDLQQAHNVDPSDNGLERFITATRRQNFLIPPRRHRSFPLLELTWR